MVEEVCGETVIVPSSINPKGELSDIADFAERQEIQNQVQWDFSASLLAKVIEARKSLSDEYDEGIKSAKETYNCARDKKQSFDKQLGEIEESLRDSMATFPAAGSGRFSVRETVVFRITGEGVLPREFLAPDMREIRRVVGSLGLAAEIPGVEVSTSYVVAVSKEEK